MDVWDFRLQMSVILLRWQVAAAEDVSQIRAVRSVCCNGRGAEGGSQRCGAQEVNGRFSRQLQRKTEGRF